MIIKLKYSLIAIHFIITFIFFHSFLFKKKSEYLIPLLKMPQLPKTPNLYKVYKNYLASSSMTHPLAHSASATLTFLMSLRWARHTLSAQELCTCYLYMDHSSSKHLVVCSPCSSISSPKYDLFSKVFPATSFNCHIIPHSGHSLPPFFVLFFFYPGLITI